MDPQYICPNENDEFSTEERCHILELINADNDRSFSIARARVEPGVTTAWHRLNETVETYYILKGEGFVEVGEDSEQALKAGELVKIPANKPQRIHNRGLEDLVFLCFCVPAFGAECYESLE